ncbi:MAG TPA: EamA family transporter [Verrucomicrobiae bacterium]|jgi:drug/metabolite transporter (DMT)-like permease|nr:EamA family transporter [Verrucomicrobiae bacterium]
MLKFLIILLIGLTFESIGVVMLKKGMGQIGDVKKISVSEVARIVKAGVTSRNILLGVFFEALFFVTLLILMSGNDISLLWPLTGLSFVFATVAAIIFLGEKVPPMRWAGVVLVVAGAVLIGYSEKANERAKAAAASSSATVPE